MELGGGRTKPTVAIRVGSLVAALSIVLAGCSDGPGDFSQESWTGTEEPTELRAPWTTPEGDVLSITEVPFGSGAEYCVTSEPAGDTPAPSACTKVFFSPEELFPASGLISFLNASPLDPTRALFIAVTRSGTAADLPCGRVEAETVSLDTPAAPVVSVIFGTASTSACPARLAFEFRRGNESQTVGTSANA